MHRSINENIGESKKKIDGIADMEIGFKVKLYESDNFLPDIGSIAHFGVPLGNYFSTNYLEPNFLIAFDKNLTEVLSFGANIGATWSEGIPINIYSLAFGIAITDKIGSFVEVFGDFSTANNPNHLLDAGFTYLLMPNFQVDASAGYALTDISDDFFLNFGFSYRIPK